MRRLKCSTCGLLKNTGEFSVDNYSKRRGGSKRGYTYSCLECLRKYRKKRKLKNPKPFLQRNAKRREQYKDPKVREKQRDAEYRSRYGIDLIQYNILLEIQNHKCKICGLEGKKNWQNKLWIDHNHKTGKVRGLLCRHCNFGVSFVEDVNWLKKAKRYLDSV